MNRVLWVVLLCSGISACGASWHDQSPEPVSSKDTHPLAKVGLPEEGTRADAPDGLPAPKTSMALQSKYTKAIPLGNGKFAHVTVAQWVFHPDGDKDGSLICVEDGNHCIALVKLKEQLNRPANDPLGILKK
jgi:hypothetical protein